MDGRVTHCTLLFLTEPVRSDSAGGIGGVSTSVVTEDYMYLRRH